ncbi:unnamed protein product [Peronospora belbahrii]|uniref:subtilisin n=1 Tax=Peronospora belbahrii TaxID=622444 RepID=A0ABN8CXG6_9STRA|nr:unnamed protein product [Peronospora belbahrii]
MSIIWYLFVALGLFKRYFASLPDAQGLEFVDTAAICAFHCSSGLLSQSEQCLPSLCGRQRALRIDEQEINVLTCHNVEQNASTLTFSFTLAREDSAEVFQGFHDTFFQAYNSMLMGNSITTDACQLAFLQDKLIPSVKDDDLKEKETMELKPKLVKLVTTKMPIQERECIIAIRQVWKNKTNEGSLLTRRGDSLGENTVLLLHADELMTDKIRALKCVDIVLDLPPILKLMPFARSAAHLSDRMRRQENVSMAAPAMEIRLVEGADRQSVLISFKQRARELLGVLNIFETSENQPRSIFTKPLKDLITWTKVLALAIIASSVEWIDERHEITQNLLRGEEQERWTQMQSHRRLDAYAPSLVGVDSAREAGIRGNDVVVGITDTGLYLYLDQFDQDDRDVFSRMVMSARKVVMYNAWANKADEAETITCGHGTHVAGLLAGSSFSGKNADLGIANKARIAFMDIGMQSETCAGELNCAVSLATPADASDLLVSQIDAGAKIFSFSWGNSGESSITGQRTISSPSGAKNVISVGASLNSAASFMDYACPDIMNEHTVASFSSAGPTTDGRMKPDVVAPGMSLISSQSEAPGTMRESSATCSLQGTSQATPVVTGVAVLLYEWLRDGWWKDGRKNAAYAMSTIPASLLKALLIHSGDSLHKRMGALPTSGFVSCTSLSVNNSGNGSRNGPPSLYFLPNSTENSEPAVAHGGEIVISFTVARGVDLRATLVWTDPPGSVQATSQLQHDLDLVVRVRNGTEMFGPLTADPNTGRDSLNNVEMVQVSYADLLAAATDSNTSSSGSENGTNSLALGNNGEIVVEAVVYGRSVLLADYQKFAFVASSSVIGSTSGIAATNDSKSFWSTWALAIIVGCVIVLLIVIAWATRWLCGRNKRGASTRYIQEPYPAQVRNPGSAFCPSAQTATDITEGSRCPYCGRRMFGLEPAMAVVTLTSRSITNTPPRGVHNFAEDERQKFCVPAVWLRESGFQRRLSYANKLMVGQESLLGSS